jgi:hypothetical protein
MESPEPQTSLQSSDKKRRRRWPRVVAVIAAMLYGASIFFYNQTLPVDLGTVTAMPPSDGVGVYFFMKDIELSTDRITVDMAVNFGNELTECNPVCGLNRDVTLLVSPSTQSKIQLPRGTPIGYSTPIVLFLEGAPYTYPFDSYKARVHVQVATTESDGSLSTVPLLTEILVPEGFVGWHIQLRYPAESDTVDINDVLEKRLEGLDPAEISLVPGEVSNGTNWAYMKMDRAFSTQIISILILTLMIILAGLTVIASHDVQVGKRPNDGLYMAGWLTGSLFAMPALRALLPGAPPLGSWIDILVFYWVIIATMISLATFVLFWVRQKPFNEPGKVLESE